MTDETAAVTAHWLLGRLSALQGLHHHVATHDGLDDERRAELAHRADLVADQMRRALEAMARGHDHPLVDLTEESATINGPQ